MWRSLGPAGTPRHVTALWAFPVETRGRFEVKFANFKKLTSFSRGNCYNQITLVNGHFGYMTRRAEQTGSRGQRRVAGHTPARPGSLHEGRAVTGQRHRGGWRGQRSRRSLGPVFSRSRPRGRRAEEGWSGPQREGRPPAQTPDPPQQQSLDSRHLTAGAQLRPHLVTEG